MKHSFQVPGWVCATKQSHAAVELCFVVNWGDWSFRVSNAVEMEMRNEEGGRRRHLLLLCWPSWCIEKLGLWLLECGRGLTSRLRISHQSPNGGCRGRFAFSDYLCLSVATGATAIAVQCSAADGCWRASSNSFTSRMMRFGSTEDQTNRPKVTTFWSH